MEIKVTINGEDHLWHEQPGEILLDVLRRHGFNSVKFGCGEGECGACTILLDGKSVRACLMVVGQVHGRQITTAEGLGTVNDPHPIQQAFVDSGAIQCGFCTPGMVLSTKALLDQEPEPDRDEIRQALDGNLCRCTGYVKIMEAVELAAKRMKR